LLAHLQVLLPLHPGLGRLLMSRQVAIRVLERRADFLERIEAAGERLGRVWAADVVPTYRLTLITDQSMLLKYDQ
jgi:hypothetical protein